MGAVAVPHLVAEPGCSGARAPLCLAATEFRSAAGGRGQAHSLCGSRSQGGRGTRRLHQRHRWPCIAGSHGVQRYSAAASDPRLVPGHLRRPRALSAGRRGGPWQDHRGRFSHARAQAARTGSANPGCLSQRHRYPVGGGNADSFQRTVPTCAGRRH